MPQALCQFKCA